MKPGILTIAVTLASALLIPLSPSVGTAAQVNVNINIGSPPPVIVAPPPVVVASPPTMLFLAEPGVYVAVGIPYNLYYVSGRYYYAHGAEWFWAAGYDGPWVHVSYRSLPGGLQRYKIAQLHVYRDREYEAYRARGPQFSGRRLVAVGGGRNRENDQGEDEGNRGNGRGNGRGRGRGNR